jgi:glycosyltransferase involved in cell wall biosynthesis
VPSQLAEARRQPTGRGSATRIVFLEPLWKLRREYEDLVRNPPDGYRFVVQQTASEGLAKRVSKASAAYRALWALWKLLPVQLAKPFWERFKRTPDGVDLTYAVLHPVFRGEAWLMDMCAEQPHLLVGSEWLFDRWKGVLRRPLLAPSCRRILYEVEAGRQAFLQRLPWPGLAEKTVVVRSAVPPRPVAQGSHDGGVKLLFVNSANMDIGSHFAVHGGLVLLEAFRHLRRRYPNVELVVRSAVPRRLKRAYGCLPGLRIIDEVIPWWQLEREFQTADIFVYPTHVTPSIVFLDAMSYGLPIVTTDVWANPELVQDGHNGLLVPHRSAAAFTEGDVVHFDSPHFRRAVETVERSLVAGLLEGVSRLIEDGGLRRRLGCAGRHEVENGRFSPSQRSGALARVLDEAIERDR